MCRGNTVTFLFLTLGRNAVVYKFVKFVHASSDVSQSSRQVKLVNPRSQESGEKDCASQTPYEPEEPAMGRCH